MSVIPVIHCPKTRSQPKQWAPTVRETQTNNICRNVCQSRPYNGGQTQCPASAKGCTSCTKMNHFASCCRSKPTTNTTIRDKPHTKTGVHVVEADDSSSDDAHVYQLTMCNVAVHKVDERPYFVVSVNGHQLEVIADSGVEINIIDERHGSLMVSTSACHAGGRRFDSRTRRMALLSVKTWLSILETVYLCVFRMKH